MFASLAEIYVIKRPAVKAIQNCFKISTEYPFSSLHVSPGPWIENLPFHTSISFPSDDWTIDKRFHYPRGNLYIPRECLYSVRVLFVKECSSLIDSIFYQQSY